MAETMTQFPWGARCAASMERGRLRRGREWRHRHLLDLAFTGLVVQSAAQAYAQYGGNEGQLSNFFNQSTTWMVTVLGQGLFVIGLIMVGISLALGNQDALRKGGYVIGGGALIFLSQALVALLRRLTGGF